MQHAVKQFSFGKNTYTDTGADGDVNAIVNVLHAAKGCFAESCHIYIGIKAYRNLQGICKGRADVIVCPGKLWGSGDATVGWRGRV